MANITNVERERMPAKTMALFFIIDTSGSMHGTRIGAVNSAIEQTLEKLRDMNADNTDAIIEVAFLEFSSGAKWLFPNGPMKVDNYYWTDLEADGLTYMGEAFKKLGEALSSKSGFLQRASGAFAPVLFLMSDGEPNDDYKTPLAKLYGTPGDTKSGNGWFKAAVKVALAIGDDANDSVLQEFTGSSEAVVRVPDGKNAGEKLAKMVQFIAVTSSQVASNPTDASNQTKQDIVNTAIQDAANEINDDDYNIDGSSGGGDAFDW
jgi:uncharacterized protein YegL